MITYKALLKHTEKLYNDNLINADIYEKMICQINVLKESINKNINEGIIYRTSYQLIDKKTNGISKIPKIKDYTDFFKIISATDKLGISKDFDLICIKSKQIGNKNEIISKQTIPLESLRLENKNLEFKHITNHMESGGKLNEIAEETLEEEYALA